MSERTTRRGFGAVLVGAMGGLVAAVTGRRATASARPVLMYGETCVFGDGATFGMVKLPMNDIAAYEARKSLAELRREADALKEALTDASGAAEELAGKLGGKE